MAKLVAGALAGAIALGASALWAGPLSAMPIGTAITAPDAEQRIEAVPVYWRRGFGWRRPGWGWRYGYGYGWHPYGGRPYGWRYGWRRAPYRW